MTDHEPASTTAERGTTLSFVIPFWNEEAGGDRCLREIREGADRIVAAGEATEVVIIAVDDGSTDATPALLARHAAEDPRIRIVQHPVNRGLGAALRSGLLAVDTDWAFYTDADLPVLPEVVVAALTRARATGADAVSCHRLGRRDGWRRTVVSGGYNLAVRIVVGLRVTDVNAPAKLFHREVIERSLPRCVTPFCDAEILARAIRGGAGVEQIGVDAHPRTAGSSSLSSPRVILETLRDLVRFGPGLRVPRRPAAHGSDRAGRRRP